jgi:hypothetical protein
MGKKENVRNIIPAEPVVILALIGLMLIGAILYYRSVNLQRFLEPSLAVLEPRTMLSSRLKDLTNEELGPEYSPGIIVLSTGLMIHKSLLLSPEYHKPSIITQRLANMLNRLFEDPWMAGNVEMIMVKTSAPVDLPLEQREKVKHNMQQQSESVLESILGTSPALAEKHSDKFAATAVLSRNTKNYDWVMLDIIPSERLHIEVLERLGKYAHKPATAN